MFSEDPFAPLDVEGADGLMQVAAAHGRVARADLKLLIRGDHWRDRRRLRMAASGAWMVCPARRTAGRSRSWEPPAADEVPYRNLCLHRLIRPAPRRVSRAASGPVAVRNAQRRDAEVLRAAVRRRVAAGQLWEPYQEDVRTFGQEYFSFVRISNSFLTIVIWLQFWILPLDGSDGPRMEEIT